MSPHFCYRVDLQQALRPRQPPRSATALGLRARQPPELLPLVEHARRRVLARRRPATCTARSARRPGAADAARRRVRGLATEFGGNWLDFRRFEEHNASTASASRASPTSCGRRCSRSRSASSSTSLRDDRSVLDFLYGEHTFVNPVLAKHYGMPEPANGEPDDWARVDDASPIRPRRPAADGGLPDQELRPACAPARSKRGYWVVRRLLGEHIPPPPPHVPELPNDEAKLGDLTLREALARHRDDKSCAGCHERFDSFGLAFEGYGPVGEARDKRPGRPRRRHRAQLSRRQRGRRPRRPARLPPRPSPGRFSSTTSAASCWPTPSAGRSPSDDRSSRPCAPNSSEQLPLQHPDRDDRDQPAVPEEERAEEIRREGASNMSRPAPFLAATMLRGAGVAMALPWLESVPVWGVAADRAPPRPRPKRFAALFMGCGVNSNHWWAKGAGDEMELGKASSRWPP